MSCTITYKGNTIASINTDTTKTLKTGGTYCEDDITIQNVQDGSGSGSGSGSGGSGWQRDPNAPNLDLLCLPNRELASGSGFCGAYVTFYISELFDSDVYIQMKNGSQSIVSIKEVSVNSDGTWTEIQDVTTGPKGKGYIDCSKFSIGWHCLRFELDENYTTYFSCYCESGILPLSYIAYETYIHIAHLKSNNDSYTSHYNIVGCHHKIIDASPPANTSWKNLIISNKLSVVEFVNCNTSNVKDMNHMFYDCNSLQSLDLSSFNTSNVTDMNNMFNGCSSLQSLDLSSFNTSNVTNMSQMFNGCSSLQSLDLSSFNTSNVTNMRYMFSGCYSLQSLDLSSFNTSNVTDMYSTIYGHYSLQSLSFGDGLTHQYPKIGTAENTWVASTDTSISSVVRSFCTSEPNCKALKNISSFPKLKYSFDLSNCNLTTESLLVVLNALETVTSSSKLTLGSTQLARLSTEQKAIATNKGWTLA